MYIHTYIYNTKTAANTKIHKNHLVGLYRPWSNFLCKRVLIQHNSAISFLRFQESREFLWLFSALPVHHVSQVSFWFLGPAHIWKANGQPRRRKMFVLFFRCVPNNFWEMFLGLSIQRWDHRRSVLFVQQVVNSGNCRSWNMLVMVSHGMMWLIVWTSSVYPEVNL